MHYLLLISVEKINVIRILCHSYFSTYSKLLVLNRPQARSSCDTNQIHSPIWDEIKDRFVYMHSSK